MQIVPLTDVPSQIFSVVLGGQSCQLRIIQRRGILFADVFVNNVAIVTGSICRNQVFLVRSVYLGFIGDLMFFDTQGSNDPSSPGLGSRYQLAYIEQSDIDAIL